MLSLTRKKYCTPQFLVCEPGKASFVHAFSGCDASSAVYEQGKLSILKLLEKSEASREEADVILQKKCFTGGGLRSWKKNICNAL